MDTTSKSAGAVTPVKDPQSNRSKLSEISKNSENLNPNVTSPGSKISKSPLKKSASKTHKYVSKNPNPKFSPMQKNKIRERKFVIAKKSTKREGSNNTSSDNVACKCNKGNGKSQKCLCVAYESLRASQEEFFQSRGGFNDENEIEELKKCDGNEEGEENNRIVIHKDKAETGCEEKVEAEEEDACGTNNELGVSTIKRRRDKLLEEARESVPDSGSGRVMHLVKAFESILSIPKSNKSEEKEENEVEDSKKGMKWALPGLQQPPKVLGTQVSSSSFCPSDFFLTSDSLGLDSCRSSSLDSSHGSISSRTSGGGRRSRRNSAESSGTFARRQWKRRQLKTTSHKPFKLRTEERGKCKEEEFMKKVQQMMEEEEKLRVPIAQGLPWTTDEPECLVKPPVKESTRPIDVVLHSDVRAVERADFDHQVSEKISLIEQYRMERERLQKLAEEEEIRRLRKELVPKAQPMPYFDRPFIPKRSMKHPTIPKEPKFHIPHHKKIKCMQQSWSDMYILQQ